MPPAAAAELEKALLGQPARSPYTGLPMVALGALDLASGRIMTPDETLTAILTMPPY